MQVLSVKYYKDTINEIAHTVGDINQKIDDMDQDPSIKPNLEETAATVEFSNYTKERLQNDMERMNESIESNAKSFAEYGKILEIARRIANGDKVPAEDERKLMEYDMKLYQSAKLAGAMANNRDPKEYDSVFKDEEDSIDEKIKALKSEAVAEPETAPAKASTEISTE